MRISWKSDAISRLGSKVFSRFIRKVEKTPCCWLWTASKCNGGYGAFNIGGEIVRVHSLSVKLSGRKSAELHVDHICRNRACLNPSHLDIVTARVNTSRGNSLSAINSRKTECLRGHRFSAGNTYYRKDRNGKFCLICSKEARLALRATRLRNTREIRRCAECRRPFVTYSTDTRRKWCSVSCGAAVRMARYLLRHGGAG